MRITGRLVVLTAMILVTANAGAEQWDFEDAKLGKLPAGWSTAKTGKGPGSVWRVLEDKTAPKGGKVLAQVSSDGPKPLFNLCVVDAASYTDVDLCVSFKGLRGKIDQGGGPVWRYKDKDNYYVARMNPLESNFRLYKVVRGKRVKLASSDVDVDDDDKDEDADEDNLLLGKWHTIRVVHRGDRIRCYLNGKLHLEAKDGAIGGAGRIGLWTKADAVTSFDNLSVAAPSE